MSGQSLLLISSSFVLVLLCVSLVLQEGILACIVAEQCGDGFNATLKPDTGADPAYVLDVDHTCVQGVIDSLPASERKAHENYNGGTTVADTYSSCTVDFAQARYSSNN